MNLRDAIVRDFDLEIPKTKAVLAAVPEDKLDWKPHEKSMTLGQLAGHVAEAPDWVTGMVEDEMDFAGIMDSYVPFVPKTGAELLEAFDENCAKFHETLEGRDDAFMQGEWTMRNGETVLMKNPREQVMREILINHGVHHRGQLTVYLRLLDAPVPGTYGPTADQASF